MIAWLVRHRTRVEFALRAAGLAATLLTIVVALLLRRHDEVALRFLVGYVAPLFAYGAEWARDRVGRARTVGTSVLAVDATAFVAGALRIAGGWGVLPYSGHMLFLTYAAVTPTTRALRLLAAALLATTSIFKLVLWHDPRSWALGIAAGLLLAAGRAVVARRAPAGVP